MAGTFKKFIGGIACESLQTIDINGGTSNVIETVKFCDTTGQYYRKIVLDFTSSSYRGYIAPATSPYGGLTPIATSDELKDYNLNDYSIPTALTTEYTKSRTYTSTGASTVYSIYVTNNSQTDDVTLSCVKFKKDLYTMHPTSNVSASHTFLICGYYLENPVTLKPSESTQINIVYSVGDVTSVS